VDDNAGGEGLPLGFGIALARNPEAMKLFASLSDSERQSVIEGAHRVRSKEEMREYVDSIPARIL